MKCGYGWEQAYEIEHHVDGKGHPFIVYTVKGGERVPSPLSNPTCLNCGGHVVRIMREGQVSSVLGMLDQLYHHRVAPGIAGPVPAGANVPRHAKEPKEPKEPKASRMAKPHETGRAHDAHDVPGPVAIDPQARDASEGRGLLGLLARLWRRIRGA
ncbi:hypothetical protein OHS33_14825 [Streptomyces sp. NBC_00536]|nr:hypothetical protein [Streptomyces sp. NBC_00536]WUC83744.1 hypothetical protein OHS33_14825 [Streptomyces sp. NBC_00536]